MGGVALTALCDPVLESLGLLSLLPSPYLPVIKDLVPSLQLNVGIYKLCVCVTLLYTAEDCN